MLSSVEVGTLITALGCGIGKDDFDLKKLRYHRIILMTDADVDGSHIRTLLLTFFYRQVPELITNGHIYIAQPPLYKVKRGKQEIYVKDESELNAMLLNSALEEPGLHVNSAAPALSGAGFEALARQYMEVQAIIRRWARRYDERLLEQLIYMPGRHRRRIRSRRTGCATGSAISRSSSTRSPTARAAIAWSMRQVDGHPARVLVSKTEHGSVTEKALPKEFFESAEYRRIVELGKTLAGMIGEGAYVTRGDAREEVGSFKQVMTVAVRAGAQGPVHPALQGPGRDEPGAAAARPRINPETRRLHAGAHRGHPGVGRDLHHADGRPGRTAPRVHREERAVGVQPRHLTTGL